MPNKYNRNYIFPCNVSFFRNFVLHIKTFIISLQMSSIYRYLASILLSVLIPMQTLGGTAGIKWNSQYQGYINRYKDIAIREMLRYGIPASITLAQGLLESGAGRSELARKGNNHFGIKCHGWTGRKTYHDDDENNECFRAYNNVLESYEDHSRFLAGSRRYRSLFTLKNTDYKGWARGLKAAGYATNPTYAQNLIDIIELYRLYEYDRAKSYDRFITEHSGDGRRYTHTIKICNRNYYIVTRRGDTFKSIGKEMGISYRKLAKYNERNKKSVLNTGDIIYLKKKRKRADKSFKNKPHIVRSGESMYSIAQKYGIRIKSLYKKNNLSPDYNIKAGDKLRVY